MKRRFRAVSCCDRDRCISYSTFEGARNRLEMWAKIYYHELFKYYTTLPYNSNSPVERWHHFVGRDEFGSGYSYIIVEFKDEEEIVITPKEMFGE